MDFADRSQSVKILAVKFLNLGSQHLGSEHKNEKWAWPGYGATAKNQEWPIRENFNLRKFPAIWYILH